MTRLLYPARIDPGENFQVSGEELHYLVRVRRHKCLDRVCVVDSNGDAFVAEIIAIDKHRAVLRVVETASSMTATDVAPVTLIVSLPKANLMDDVVRKLSEIGIKRLVPVRSERTAHVVPESRVDRWRRIALEAIRQSGRATPLDVRPIVAFSRAVAEQADQDRATKLLLHPKGDVSLVEVVSRSKEIIMAIGPEGGFTEDELARARQEGYRVASLPMPILRIETAAIATGAIAVALVGKAAENGR